MTAKQIEGKAREVADLLNQLGEALQERGIPRTEAGKAIRHNLRDGWELNTAFIYTMQSRERELPENYAE